MKTKSNMTVENSNLVKEEDWEQNLLDSARVLADNLQIYNASRECSICGASPEHQAKWVIKLVRDEKQKSFEEGYKKGVKDEIECVETSGEHLDLQKKLKIKKKI